VLEFLTGCALAQAFLSLKARLPSRRELVIARIATGLAAANFALFILRDDLLGARGAHAVWSVGLLPAIAVLVFCCARYRVRMLSAAPIVALGEASYSMYLLHLIVIDKSAPTEFVNATLDNIVILAIRAAIVIAIIIVLSLGTHRYFEMPARKFLRRRLSLGSQPALSLRETE
jgi:peptidoglycan/LPS O-acetylase OafA/YrhL